MENLTLTTPSILFSAISLIMLAYTNRFLSYAQVVRNLKAEHDKNPSQLTQRQLDNLRKRLYLSRSMQVFGISSLLLCVCCTFFIYIGLGNVAIYTFGIALLLLVISLAISIREVLISVRALEVNLISMKPTEQTGNRQRSSGRSQNPQSSRPKMSYDTMETFSEAISTSGSQNGNSGTGRGRSRGTKKSTSGNAETVATAPKSGGNRGRKPANTETATGSESGTGNSGAAQEVSKPRTQRSRSSKPRTSAKAGDEAQTAEKAVQSAPETRSPEKQEE